jgi:hypothetical protein
MLAEVYVEARPADESAADRVWSLWQQRRISDALAALARLKIAKFRRQAGPRDLLDPNGFEI